ncbi:MAG TPA: hypothetical protein VH253_15560 [Phycisphaerae bacterium]|nr:hypothetical protein [Phycisphaerae bacterium]
MSRCQACGRNAPTKHVRYYQNIGMLFMRQLRTVDGSFCKRCSRHFFLKLTGLTLVTGWWGLISAIMNPFLIINNVVRFVGTLSLAEGADATAPLRAGYERPRETPTRR